jgi:hypothetical protein
MMAEPFEAAWQRWERARVHMSEAVEVWNAFIGDPDAFDFSLDGEGDGIYILRVLQHRDVPAGLAIALGEWLYNLRASLDYVMWATACYVAGQVPPPNEGVLQYPIYDNEAAWKKNQYRLKGLHPHHRDMLFTMQPFNSNADANYLGWVNRLARSDRHRTLVTGAARIAELEPVVQVPDQTEVTVEWGDRTVIDGHADVARLTVRPYEPGRVVSVNPRIGIDPEIAEWSRSPFWARWPFDDRLKMIQVFTAGEIAAYEYDCTGGGRKSDLVSDHFRTESDARRGQVPQLARIRPPVSWTPAGPAKPSTRERFQGLDFPGHGSGPRSATLIDVEEPDAREDLIAFRTVR